MLLPVRDGAEHLPGALRSLIEQTLTDLEIVVVDDGSTDATPDVLGEWAASDDRVRAVRTPPLGIVAALERARAESRGRYLARMDADDVSEPRRLEAQLELMEGRPEVVASGTRVRYFPEERVRGGALRYERWINSLTAPDELERGLFVECPLPHPTFFLRADAVEAVGGYRDPGWPEDHDLLLRLWEAGGRFRKVPEVLLRWREHPERLSRVEARYSAEAFRRCKVHFLLRTLLRERRGAVVWGAGPTGKAFARTLLAREVPLRAFVDLDPRKIGQQIHGAPVIEAADAERFRGALFLAAVGREGARDDIRASLRALGLREMEDFVAVA